MIDKSSIPTDTDRQHVNNANEEDISFLGSDTRQNAQNNASSRFMPKKRNLFLTLYFLTALLMNGAWKPLAQRGFFCGDLTIQYPIKVDTVGFKTLLFVAWILPSIVIFLCDKQIHRFRAFKRISSYKKHKSIELDGELQAPYIDNNSPKKRRPLSSGSSHSDNDLSNESNINKPNENQNFSGKHRFQLISDDKRGLKILQERSKLTELQVFMMGVSTTVFLTGLGKMSCGRLRPHFMQKCLPDIDCSLKTNIHRYIEDFNCTNIPNESRSYNYITTSWPSGHASIIFYSMIYMSLYLHRIVPLLSSLDRKARSLYDPIFLYIVDVALISLAMYIATTRITDYHHHTTDVLSGISLGASIAIIMPWWIGRHERL